MVETGPAQRKLAAILAADVAGYSRLMGTDEEGTLRRLKALRAELIDPTIAEHRGRIVKTTGDGMLVEFQSVVDAMRCAIAVQDAMCQRNADVPPGGRIEFRVGINLGDVIIDGEDIFGDGVNIAARLEAMAEPGGICIERTVLTQTRGKLDFPVEDLGEQSLKNIAQRVHVFRVLAREKKMPETVLPLPEKPSIAVLPFQNMSGDPEQEYFADGIAEDVITLLSKSRGLIEAATGGHLWAERYDRDLSDIFAVQDEITEAVSTAILPTMERSERERAARKPPGSLDAWECYHRGLWHFSKVEAGENALALSFFERAIELDPGFAAAHAIMSYALMTQAVTFRPPAERRTLFPRAAEHARRAIALDPTDALGHASLSRVLMHAGRHEEAMAEADLAVSLDPSSTLAHACQGSTRVFGGRPRDAIEPIETAMRLSPFDPATPFFLNARGRASYYMGDYSAALATARQVYRSFPNYQNIYRTLIAALGQTGQADEAHHVMAEALERFGPDFRFNMAPLGPTPMEDRAEDRERMLDGYRKAGVLD
jgi:adenylate cyclase